MVNLTIDGKQVTVPVGTSILDAAKTVSIKIPTLCFLKELNEIAACRVCMVEVEGAARLVPSCATKVKEGMVVHTNTRRVREARDINLQLILSQHDCNCPTCLRNGNCTLQDLARDSNLIHNPFHKNVPRKSWSYDNYLIRNEHKCIKCMRCVQICEKVQNMKIWDVVNTGSRTTVGVSLNREFKDTDCTLCGQCVTHCPTGAITERDDTEKVYRVLDDPELITVVQVAPAVRTAWAENLGLKPKQATTGRMVAALRQCGFDYVFDTNFAADLTIMEEGSEFLERFTHQNKYLWPMFTSCCPGWVRFLKSQYPGYTANLSTAKSPQQMFGSVAKSYFAEKMGIDPHKIRVISVMPCLAKKSECDQPNQNDACGDPDVDFVLTTREFARMLRRNHVDVTTLSEEQFDSPLGSGTGAAVIFGATGGVMDAALRTAYNLVTGHNPDPDTFTAVRGMDGWKEATFSIPGAGDVKVAVVSGLANTRKLMEAIDRGEVSYHFVEVMACPGGCAGGGGQPIHDGMELAEQRGNTLWRLDRENELRFSHENPDIITLYREYLEKPMSHKAHHLLHTDHTGWEMPLNPNLK